MRMSRIAKIAGYTLIEMVLVIVIAGILMSVGVVRLAPALVHANVRAAANVVAGDLQYAQSLAVRHRKPIAVVVASATKQYLIRDRDDATNVYRTRLLGPETDFGLDELTSSPTSVELFPNGVARETMVMTLGIDGFQRQVRLTRAGQIRILRP